MCVYFGQFKMEDNFACALPIQNSAVNGTPLLPTEYSLVPVPTTVRVLYSWCMWLPATCDGCAVVL